MTESNFRSKWKQMINKKGQNCLFCHNGDMILLSTIVTSGLVAWQDLSPVSDRALVGSWRSYYIGGRKKSWKILWKYRKAGNAKKTEIHVGNWDKYKKLANPAGSLGPKKGCRRGDLVQPATGFEICLFPPYRHQHCQHYHNFEHCLNCQHCQHCQYFHHCQHLQNFQHRRLLQNLDGEVIWEKAT